MAGDLHKLAIQIQGDIDERFGGAIKDVTGHLKQLENGVKTIADSKIKPGGISSEFIKLNTEAGEVSQQINQLNRQMKQVDGFQSQQKAASESFQRYVDLEAEVLRLEQAHKESGTREFTAALKNAKKEAAAAEKAYNKENKTLNSMKEGLKKAGVNTDDLANEQKRLASEIESTAKKSGELSKSLQGLTRSKYHFEQLRGYAKRLGSDILWVGKTYLKMAGGISAAGFGLFKLVDSAASAGDAAAKTAAKLSMNVEALQELRYAAKKSGIGDLDGILTKFSSNVAKAAKGEGDLAKSLKEIGISGKQLYKMGPEKALMVLSDEMNKIKDPAKRARLELALYGQAGAEMGVLLKRGSKGIQTLRDEAHAAGAVMSKEAVEQAAAFKDAKERMGATLGGLKNIIGGELFPIFTETFGEISRLFIENQAVVKDFAKSLAGSLKDGIPELKKIVTGAGTLAAGLWKVAKVVIHVVGGVGNLGMVLAALPLAKPIVTIGKMGFALGRMVGSLASVKGAIFAVGKALALSPIGLAVVGIATAAFLIYKYWGPIKGFFINTFNTMSSGIQTVKESFAAGYRRVKAIFGSLRDEFARIPGALIAAFKGVTDIITKPFGKAFDWVGEKWASLKGTLGIGPKIDIPKDAFAMRPISQRARGGRSSIPTLTTFAERGPEIAIPAGLADRSHGLASLDLAHRALGLGSLDLDKRSKSLSKGGAEALRKQEIRLEADISPHITFYQASGDTTEIQQRVMDAMRDCGARLFPEWLEQIRRLSYETT